MSSRLFLRSFLPASILLAAAAIPAPAAAFTFICPGGPGPGEVQVGVQHGPGFNGVPVCAQDPNAPIDDGSDGAGGAGPAADPMVRRQEAAIDTEKAALVAQVESMQKESDPNYQRYANGGWEYFQDAPDAKPGELCTAFFAKQGGYVAVTSPGGDSPNAYLTFWGADVPRPTQVKKVKITLAQSGGDPPQTVMAFNTFNPATSLGGLILAVPTVDALLDNMLDVHNFAVSIGGKPVAEVEWTGGHAARDKLKSCIRKRQ
jgi:hypothetical protein